MKKHRSLVWLSLLLALAGCYTVPETGRSAFIIPLGDEVAEGAAAFAEIKSKEKLSSDPVQNEQVRRVGERIAQAVGSDLPSAKWEFVVFDEPKTINAFALPGGKVGVYSGLIQLVDSDDEIAIVMGHEIAHVTARHGAQRATQGVVAAGLGVVLGVATNDSSNRDAILIGYGLAAGGATLAFSRSHESEADHIGLRYAAKAGYDPHAAITFWQKMAAQDEGSNMPTLLRTHPTDEKRISELQRWLPEALPLYEAAKLKYGK
jgi:metalloendopeptidase OMA1, mitochondrial